MITSYLLVLATALSVVLAAYQVPESDFTENGGFVAAQLGQPLFWFASGSCYPQPAIDSNGNQVDSWPPDECNIDQLDQGCENKIWWPGHNQNQGALEPIYFSINKCGDNTYRIIYEIFFVKDSGHRYDWEWVTVVWHQDDAGLFYTSHVILEQDSNHAVYPWANLDTFDDNDDMFNNGYGANKNHPKIYVSKFHHSMHVDPCDFQKNNCIPIPTSKEFRGPDFYLFNLDVPNLYPISVINPNWNFGEATNPHATASYICGDSLGNGGPYCGNPTLGEHYKGLVSQSE